jgi:WD40 repeat protein
MKIFQLGADGLIFVWKFGENTPSHTISQHEDWVTSLVLHKEGVISSSHDKTLRIFDSNTKQIKNKIRTEFPVNVMTIWNEDIAIGEYCTGKPALVQVLDISGTTKMKVEGHMEGITSLCIWKDFLLSGSADKKVCLWNKSGKAQSFLMPGAVRHLTVIENRIWCTASGSMILITWEDSNADPAIDLMNTSGTYRRFFSHLLKLRLLLL